MSWDLLSSFRREFTSTSNGLIFKTKVEEVKNFNLSKIIELTIIRTNAKQKTYGFSTEIKAFAINQIRGNIKKMILDDVISRLFRFRSTIHQIFPYNQKYYFWLFI